MRIQISQNTPPSSTNVPGIEDPIDTGDSSPFSQAPEWLLSSVAGAVVTALLATILTVRFWKPIWRWISRRPPIYVHVETDPRIIFANLEYDWITFPQFIPRNHDALPPTPVRFRNRDGGLGSKIRGNPGVAL